MEDTSKRRHVVERFGNSYHEPRRNSKGTYGNISQLLRSGGLKVRLAQVDYVGEFKGKGSGRVFGNDQR